MVEPAAAAKGKKDDDNASAIAEKLLQGWTMLAEYCPVEGCQTPLMRSREGKRFCVAHDMFVMSPEEAAAMKRDGKGVAGIEASSPTHAAPAPRPAERIDFYRQLKDGSSPSTIPEPVVAMDAAPTPPTPTPTALPSTATDASDTRVNVDAVARATMDTVARKMSDARALLAQIPDVALDREKLLLRPGELPLEDVALLLERGFGRLRVLDVGGDGAEGRSVRRSVGQSVEREGPTRSIER